MKPQGHFSSSQPPYSKNVCICVCFKWWCIPKVACPTATKGMKRSLTKNESPLSCFPTVSTFSTSCEFYLVNPLCKSNEVHWHCALWLKDPLSRFFALKLVHCYSFFLVCVVCTTTAPNQSLFKVVEIDNCGKFGKILCATTNLLVWLVLKFTRN